MNHFLSRLFCAMVFLIASGAPSLAEGWTHVPPSPYDVKAVRVEGVSATVTIDVKDTGPVIFDMNGSPDVIAQTKVRVSGGSLLVEGRRGKRVWDWRGWFNFHDGKDDRKKLYIHMVVPKAMAVKIATLSGTAYIGNTEGPLNLGLIGDSEAKVGLVGDADVSLAGGGKATIEGAGRLHMDIAGSGKIHSGDACDVHAEIAGSGSITMGRAKCRLHVEIAGSGDFVSAGVNGPTHVEIAGSGAVKIFDGYANPLHVEIMGSGDVAFGGLAENPHIESMGSGNVHLNAYRGELHKEGNTNLKIGEKIGH